MSEDSTDTLLNFNNAHEEGVKFSFSSWDIFNIVDKNVISTVVCLLGVASNIINLLVFLRQGFSDPVNVSLLGLTVSDIGVLLSLLSMNLCTNPLIYTFTSIPYHPAELAAFAGLLYIAFSEMSCCVTIFITIQRCLCISFPLKIKHMMTPDRTALVLASMSLAIFFLFIFPTTVAGSGYIGWKNTPLNNKSILGLIFNDNHGTFDDIRMYIVTAAQVLLFVAIVASTTILVVQLKRQARWRNSSKALSCDRAKYYSQRDNKLSRMVVVLSIVLIVCIVPSTASLIVNFFMQSVGDLSSIDPVYSFFWTFGAFCEALNSSLNICVYYKVSSKYRQVFNAIMCVCQLQKYSETGPSKRMGTRG